MLSVRNMKFTYGERAILDGVSFDAEPNTVVSILGPNGTGKTTLLKCMCNLLHPQEGTVTIDGMDVLSMSGREMARHIGLVPQNTPPNGSTVFDTALIGRKPHMDWGMSKKDHEITWNVLKSLGLDQLALKKNNEISGGEYQKVQIARAIVQEPQVLILDEPTNNLDISNQHRTMHTIMEMANSRNMCTIMTMHDINLAVHYSDKFLFMKDGKTFAYGDSDIITEDLIRDVYGIESEVIYHKDVPVVLPKYSAKYGHGHGEGEHHDHDVHDHILDTDDGSWEKDKDPFE